MPTISPAEAAADALVAHLTTELGASARVLRGWPEHAVDLDLGTLPVVAVTWQQPTAEECSPKVVDSETGDPGDPTTYTYRVAWLTIPAAIEVFAAYRAVLDDVGLLVEAALHNRLPNAPGLRLTMASYYGRSLTGTQTGERADADSTSAERGEFRKTYFLELATDRVVQTTHPALTRLDLALLIESGGVETETTFTLAEA